MENFSITFTPFILLRKLGLATLIILIILLTSCNNDGCEGSNSEMSTFYVVIAYVDEDSGDNLLEIDGAPISFDSVQIIREDSYETTDHEYFNIKSSPQFADLGTYLALEYEFQSGLTNFIITLSHNEPDTISFSFVGDELAVSYKNSTFFTYTLCTTLKSPSLIISK